MFGAKCKVHNVTRAEDSEKGLNEFFNYKVNPTDRASERELKRGSITFKNHFPFPWGGKLTADFPVA